MKFKANLTFILLVLTFSFLFPDLAHSNDKFHIGGYYKNFFTIIGNPDLNGNGIPAGNTFDGLVANTLRLEALWRPSDYLSLNLAYALNPQIGMNASNMITALFPAPNPLTYRIFDPKREIYQVSASSGTFMLFHNIDRLNVTFSLGNSEMIFGRQPIAFGSARIINPTDVFTPFLFQELDKEERMGIDALRIKMPAGDLGELDFGYVFGDKFTFSQSALFSRAKLYILNTDVSPIFIIFRNNLLLGFDLARTIGGASVWIEGAYVFANLLDGYNSSQNYFRISAGIDYRLAEGLYGIFEYHFNGAGKIKAADYFDLLTTNAYVKGSVFLVGMHYIAPGLSWEISPLVNLTGQVILNAIDPSTFITLLLQYNISENIYVDVGTFLTFGALTNINGVLNPVITIGSEYGVYPNLYYVSCRFYF